MDTSIFTDLTKTGPGIWFLLHTEATKATTDENKRSFIIFVNALCDNFKCQTCKTHFRNFINKHPFLPYWNIKDDFGRDIGFYKWTWELHNQVNKFLNKPQPSLLESYDYYSNNSIGICTNCPNISINHQNPVEEILVPYVLEHDTHPNKNNLTTNKNNFRKFRLLSRHS